MIFDTLIKPALDSVTTLISQFHLSPEDKLKADQAVAAAAAQARQASVDYDVQLNTIAGQNIRSETGSADKFTSRARPAFMYVVIAVLGFNYMFLPLAMIFGSKVAPIVLPPDLLTLFGFCVGGYAASRTIEKVMSAPGDSQISVMGVKVGNKS